MMHKSKPILQRWREREWTTVGCENKEGGRWSEKMENLIKERASRGTYTYSTFCHTIEEQRLCGIYVET